MAATVTKIAVFERGCRICANITTKVAELITGARQLPSKWHRTAVQRRATTYATKRILHIM